MKGVPQGRYTREFRQEAVKLIMEEKLSFPEAGRRLSLAPSTLSYWVKAHLGRILPVKQHTIFFKAFSARTLAIA